MSAPAAEAPAAEDPAGRRELRPLAAVLTATAVSLTGTRISAVALPWFVLATSGSATRTGLVAFCEMAPYVLAKALTGPLLDRVGPRRASWTADAASAVAAALVPLLHALGCCTSGRCWPWSPPSARCAAPATWPSTSWCPRRPSAAGSRWSGRPAWPG